MSEFEIKAREDGPYLISGSAVVIDADGNESEVQGKMVALCRCGGSSNKPFCDGTHRVKDFKASSVTVRLAATE